MTIKEISIAIIAAAFVYIATTPEPPSEPEPAPAPIFTSAPITVPLPEPTHPAYSWIIPPIFHDVQWPINDGPARITYFHNVEFDWSSIVAARVTYNGLHGIVDAVSGKILVPPTFNRLGSLHAFPNYFSAWLEGYGWGVTNAVGDVILPFEYRWITIRDDYGIAIVSKDSDDWRSRQHSVVELATGREIVPFGVYHEIFSIRDGIAIARNFHQVERPDAGFINIITSEEVVPLIYDFAQPFSNGLAAVWLDDKCGFVDASGAVIIPLIYDSIVGSGFIDGVAIVERDGLFGIIDTAGAYILPPTYDWISFPHDNVAIMRIQDPISGNAYFGAICIRTGEEIVPAIYSGGWLAGESLAIMNRGDWGNRTNYLVCLVTGHEIAPFPYASHDDTYRGPEPPNFIGGMALVWVINDNRAFSFGFGLVDATGKEVLPPVYEVIFRFSDGLFAVSHGLDQWGLMDRSGQEILPPIFNSIEPPWWRGSDNLAAVSIDGLWGFIDNAGQIVIPIELNFAQVRTAGYGVAAVQTHDNLWGFIRILE